MPLRLVVLAVAVSVVVGLGACGDGGLEDGQPTESPTPVRQESVAGVYVLENPETPYEAEATLTLRDDMTAKMVNSGATAPGGYEVSDGQVTITLAITLTDEVVLVGRVDGDKIVFEEVGAVWVRKR